MTENFFARSDEAIDGHLAATWYKGAGGLNNQNGQMIMTSQRLVFCARNRAVAYLVTGAVIDSLIKSEKIRFQVAISDIKSITSYKRMGFKTTFIVRTTRWEGEEFRFTFNPGAKSRFLSWCNKAQIRIRTE